MASSKLSSPQHLGGHGKSTRGESVHDDPALERPLISLIVPCYNEAEGVEETIRQIFEIAAQESAYAFELIVVDDHSSDATPQILARLAALRSDLKVLRLGANRGSHVACRAGLEAASGKAALFLTADLQEGPELLAPVLQAWQGGAGLVCTIPETRDRGSRLADLYAFTYYGLLKHSGRLRHVGDVRASVRMLDREAIDYYCQHAPRHHNMNVWLLQQGFQIAFVGYQPRQREFGNSKWGLKKRLKLAADTLLDVTPLLLTGWLLVGALLALLGLGLAVLPYFASPSEALTRGLLLASVPLTGGLVLLALGCHGVYLWRLHDGLRHGPEHTVQWAINLDETSRWPAPPAGLDTVSGARRQS